MSDDGIPPLAPDDKPFDFDDEPSKPITSSRWWVLIAVIVTLAMIALLASPIIAMW
jgi:hypothetical protein